jgi:hypothetical protein
MDIRDQRREDPRDNLPRRSPAPWAKLPPWLLIARRAGLLRAPKSLSPRSPAPRTIRPLPTKTLHSKPRRTVFGLG